MAYNTSQPPSPVFLTDLLKSGWYHDVRTDTLRHPQHTRSIPMRDVMGGSHSPWQKWETSDDPRAKPPPRWTPYQKLAMRLNIPEGQAVGINNVHIAEGTNQTHIFLMHDDQCLIISDDKNTFPSDTAVAKVNLFLEAMRK